MYLERCLVELGEFAEASLHGREALQIAEAVGQPYDVILACRANAHPQLVRGSVGDAMPFLERAVELCRSWNVRFLLSDTVTTLGSAYVLAGRVPEAIPLLEEGAAQAGGRWIATLTARIDLASGYLAAGRIGEAAEVAERAVALAKERKSRGNLARALWLLGEINVRRDPIEASQAEEFYRQALTISSELEMRPLIAHCHAGLGKLYRRIDKRQAAQEHLATATTMFRELDMQFWLKKAAEELKSLA